MKNDGIIGYVVCRRLGGKVLPIFADAVVGVDGWICECFDVDGLPRWTGCDSEFHDVVFFDDGVVCSVDGWLRECSRISGLDSSILEEVIL